VLLTVTLTSLEVVSLPAVSRARALILCSPLATPVLAQEIS
jgi:hypothetical protein